MLRIKTKASLSAHRKGMLYIGFLSVLSGVKHVSLKVIDRGACGPKSAVKQRTDKMSLIML